MLETHRLTSSLTSISANFIRNVLCLFIFAFAIPSYPLAAQSTHEGDRNFRVDEKQIKAVIKEDAIEIILPIMHNGDTTQPVVKVELVDPNNLVLATEIKELSFKPGQDNSIVHLSLPIPNKKSKDKDQYLYARLKYSIFSFIDKKPELSRIVALAAVTPDLYELNIAHARTVFEGQTFLLRIHAANPVTRAGVAGVAVNAQFVLDDEKAKTITLKAQTNGKGDVAFRFPVPKSLTQESISVKIEAAKLGTKRTEEFDVNIDHQLKVIVSTDKPLYQPGQQLHVRMLAFAHNRTALADQEFEFILENPDDETVLQGNGKTNKFGIASVDWELPPNMKLGDYTVKVGQSGEDHDDERPWRAYVKVSRYDLPNFTVQAKPDKTYYLPGQDAEFQIDAMYLFGKPVTHGTVRVVRESERSWNYKEQKWEKTEEQERTGTLNDLGQFKLHVDLKELHDDFQSESYRKFQDHTYAAYVTDTTSGRTEQRRFKLRISHDPIHVYVSNDAIDENHMMLHISTFYPDGAPAQCHLKVSEADDDDNSDDSDATLPGRMISTVETNKYGIAKIREVRINKDHKDENNYKIVVLASDQYGNSVKFVDSIWTYNQGISLTANHAIYKPGEPIEVRIASSFNNGTLMLDIAQDYGVLYTQSVRLHSGKAFIIVPYMPKFQGVITLVAYSLEQAKSRYDFPYAYVNVIYPHEKQLQVKMTPTLNHYKPGEEFMASLRIRGPDGSPQTSAIGVVVVDKAVEERARTDEEFGGRRRGFWDWSWWEDRPSYGGVGLEDLDKLDLTAPIADDMQLVAEMILNQASSKYSLEMEGYEYRDSLHSKYRVPISTSLNPIAELLKEKHETNWHFPQNFADLNQFAKSHNIDLAELKDPWGTPYRFVFTNDDRNSNIRTESAGPDKKFDTEDDLTNDTYDWNNFTPYARTIEKMIAAEFEKENSDIHDQASLQRAVQRSGMNLDMLRSPKGNRYRFEVRYLHQGLQLYVYIVEPNSSNTSGYWVWSSTVPYFIPQRERLDKAIAASNISPSNVQELDTALATAGMKLSTMLDPWGHPFYPEFSRESQYGDRIVVQNDNANNSTTIPVTRIIEVIRIRSTGADGTPKNADDFTVATFTHLLTEQSGADLQPNAANGTVLIAGTGAIRGTVTDQTGAVIVNAVVSAYREDDNAKYSAQSNSNGEYLIRNIDPGMYKVDAASRGFIKTVIKNVGVFSGNETKVNLVLRVAASMETIEVTAEAVATETTSSQVLSSKALSTNLKTEGKVLNFTPRVRDYFPETLYWAPSVLTDKSGNAQIKFKLADSITTWKFNLVASTIDGHIGATEAEITAFQPFFVDHAPPRILTMGDEIDLPVTVRNYTEKSQTVNVEMKPTDWMTLLGKSLITINVPASDSTNAIFPFRAKNEITDGKQRVTAANRTLGDAIEKPVSVHPDGQETSAPVSAIIKGSGTLQFDVPNDAMRGSLRAELKLYPNLLAQIADSIEGGLQRPYGCGEQTISSTYPSLLLLRYFRDNKLPNEPIASRAQKYLEQGHQRLLNYQDTSGGFTYWGHGDPDIALTAYALRFLTEAKEFTTVDQDAIDKARTWLIKAQGKDGAWLPHYYSSPNLTAYVVRMLARTAPEKPTKEETAALQHAKEYLDSNALAKLDPYTVAQDALAATTLKDNSRTAEDTARLRKMAHHEGTTVYWSMETNTPFYGWGTAGRVETTALVLNALSAGAKDHGMDDPLLQAGLEFLLKQRDHNGVWYSGQATVNVLDALLEMLQNKDGATSKSAKVFVNGTLASTLDITSASKHPAPLTLEITKWAANGTNKVEVQMDGNSSAVNVSITPVYYMPWKVASTTREITEPGESRGLRLMARYDKPSADAGEVVKCHVEVERIGHRGYGMLLAEIGLPPGAEVDRDSLEKEMRNSWNISQYDILPDRVVLYLWPSAGGTKLEFNFRPRYGMRAKTAPSILYDYYNPEAQVTVPPENFRVKGKVQ